MSGYESRRADHGLSYNTDEAGIFRCYPGQSPVGSPRYPDIINLEIIYSHSLHIQKSKSTSQNVMLILYKTTHHFPSRLQSVMAGVSFCNNNEHAAARATSPAVVKPPTPESSQKRA